MEPSSTVPGYQNLMDGKAPHMVDLWSRNPFSFAEPQAKLMEAIV